MGVDDPWPEPWFKLGVMDEPEESGRRSGLMDGMVGIVMDGMVVPGLGQRMGGAGHGRGISTLSPGPSLVHTISIVH